MSRAIVVALCWAFATPALSEESVRDEAERWIEKKMRTAIERPRCIEMRLVDTPPPAWLAGAPAHIVDAWRSYRALDAALQKRVGAVPPKPGVGISQFNLGDTNSPVRRFLRGERVDLLHEASRLYWSNSLCATGIEPFINDHARMVLMGLLETEDHAAAAAAVLSHDASTWRMRMADDGLVPHYLQALGFDWEWLYLGARIATYDPGPAIELRDFRRRLVQRGSARVVRGLLALSRLRPFDTPSELAMLGEFVKPGPHRSLRTERPEVLVMTGGPGSPSYSRRKKLYLEPSEQGEILERLAAFVNGQTSHADLERVVWRLADLRRTEGKPALRRALGLASRAARESAASGLRAMGEAVEKVDPLPPVPFRIVVDGKPLAGRAVTFDMWWNNEDTTSSSSSVKAMTDAHGRAFVPRSELADPARQKWGGRLHIRSVPSSPDDPRFDVERPLAAPPVGREVVVDVVLPATGR